MSEQPDKNEDAAPEEKHVDEDWKAEAQQEKESLAEEPDAPSAGPLPTASFELLISSFVVQALISMGAIANPVTHEQTVDVAHAKHTIDLLSILEEKTRGNLTDEEKAHLDGVLYDLRLRYVALSSG